MYIGIILTILIGLFFLIGILILKNAKNKEKLTNFTTALAFIVMLGLLCLDLIPEIIEMNNYKLLIPALIGFLILIILDKLIPHHHHEHTENCDKVDHNNHLNHIGIITIIALAIHNMIEGASLYSVTLNEVKSGLLMMVSISLHNIPLGFQIGSSLKKDRKSIILITILCLSSLIGALLMIAFGSLNENIISILISLTFGMLIYITFFELFNEIKSSLTKDSTIYGIIVGIVILCITYIL